MPRVKRGTLTHKRHSALLERTKGFRTGRRKLFKRAHEADLRAFQNAYRDRRNKKRMLRSEWIVRINAAVRPHGLTYSNFMNMLKVQNLPINRKVLSDMALNDLESLNALIKKVAKAK